MELTDKMIEDAIECRKCSECSFYIIGKTDSCRRVLARELQAERAKQKDDLWEKALDGCTDCHVHYTDANGQTRRTIDYHRELPKTRAREIAEEYAEIKDGGYVRMEVANLIESAILKARAERWI